MAPIPDPPGIGGFSIGYGIAGRGPVVMLLHSSVAGRRQWRALGEALEDRYTVVAVDLIGYGDTPAWTGGRPESLADQAALVHELARRVGPPLALVGHSIGASVALCAAAELSDQLSGLILLEPNPFWLLEPDHPAELAEALALQGAVKNAGLTGDWGSAAERFADYWNGDGSWAGLSEERREKFAAAIRPNFHEWDAVMIRPDADYVQAIRAQTLVICARDTVRPIAAIAAILESRRPDWEFAWLAHGGHMAPRSHPELVNPIVGQALDALPRRR
jgi:pimeloyl-ACP methyl ester carboxylesterase